MVNIAICMPVEKYRKELLFLLNEYCEQRTEQPILLHYYSTVEELKNARRGKKRFSIYILDLDMEERRCIRLIQELGEQGVVPGMIGISRDPPLAEQVQRTLPVECYTIPVDGRRLFLKLDQLMSSRETKIQQYYLIKGPEGKRRVAFSEIVFVERYDRCLQFHLTDGSVMRTRKLREGLDKKLETILQDARFIRSHSSFVVNLLKVVQMEKSELYMQDGTCVPISARRYREVKQALEKLRQEDLASLNRNQTERFTMKHPELNAFERVPLGVAVMRVDVDTGGAASDFVFVYMNQALCRLEGIAREKALGLSYYTVFKNSDKSRLNEYWETAYLGRKKKFILHNPEIDKHIRVVTYQPWYGYCGCILEELSDKSGS